MQRQSGRAGEIGCGLLVLVMACGVANAGKLEPPGPPAPTMEHLIRADDLPLTITTPGTYRLAGNIVATGGGITIQVSNVTIDLMGFTLWGAGTSSGIQAATFTTNIQVRNGGVAGWSTGISLGNGSNSLVSDVRAEGNINSGIFVGPGSVVSNCVARNNNIGIFAASGTVIRHSTANSNVGAGFAGGSGVSVTNCAAYDNGDTGFLMGSGCTVKDSTAYENFRGFWLGGGGVVTGCSAYRNDTEGFVTDGSQIVNSSAHQNGSDGIRVGHNASVVGNLCHQNGDGGTGAGIRVTGKNNRIEGNNLVNNDFGLDVDQGGNIIIRNTASDNGQNYAQVASGNAMGGVQTLSAGFTDSNSWANYSY